MDKADLIIMAMGLGALLVTLVAVFSCRCSSKRRGGVPGDGDSGSYLNVMGDSSSGSAGHHHGHDGGSSSHGDHGGGFDGGGGGHGGH